MQPESKKEKVTKMNNYSWIYKFNSLMIFLPENHFSIMNEGVFIRFSISQSVSDVSWLNFACSHKSNLVEVRVKMI